MTNLILRLGLWEVVETLGGGGKMEGSYENGRWPLKRISSSPQPSSRSGSALVHHAPLCDIRLHQQAQNSIIKHGQDP